MQNFKMFELAERGEVGKKKISYFICVLMPYQTLSFFSYICTCKKIYDLIWAILNILMIFVLNINISPSRYILKYSRTLLKFIVQKVLTVLLPFHNLDLKLVNVWPQKKIFFTVTFSTFNFFFFQTTFQSFHCLSVESIFLRRFFGKLWRAFLGLWFDLFWF